MQPVPGCSRKKAQTFPAMFSDWTSPLHLACTPRSQRHISGLVLFSQACQRVGVHPAQGIRLAQRCYGQDYSELKAWPTLARATQLAVTIKLQLQHVKAPKILVACARQPEHFLLETQLPKLLSQVTGYVSPVLDVQPDIHFIRTQRRYNKRRYARVRAISRPSFWAGMMLSTVATGAFWGSTIQSTGWLTTAPLLTDSLHWILAGYVLVVYRFSVLFMRANVPYARELNSARTLWYTTLRDSSYKWK